MNKGWILPLVMVGVFVVGFGLGFKLGADRVSARWELEKKETAEKSLVSLNEGLTTSYKLGLQYEEEKESVKFITETIIKEVPKYIKDTSSCPSLPDGWGLLHDIGAGY